MNYNFIADCKSKGIEPTHLIILSVLNEKFDFKPGCIKIGAGTIDIRGENISILIQKEADNKTTYFKIPFVGYFR